jgi:hypothetical protein
MASLFQGVQILYKLNQFSESSMFFNILQTASGSSVSQTSASNTAKKQRTGQNQTPHTQKQDKFPLPTSSHPPNPSDITAARPVVAPFKALGRARPSNTPSTLPAMRSQVDRLRAQSQETISQNVYRPSHSISQKSLAKQQVENAKNAMSQVAAGFSGFTVDAVAGMAYSSITGRGCSSNRSK